MIAGIGSFIIPFPGSAQSLQESADSLVVSNDKVKVIIDKKSGKISYRFNSDVWFANTVAYVHDLQAGYLSTADFNRHHYAIDDIDDPLGKGSCINLVHEDSSKAIRLIQHITIYADQSFVLISAEGEAKDPAAGKVETRNISPISVLPALGGKCLVPGFASRFVDFPFDNDNWVDVISSSWPVQEGKKVSGISYELASVHDAVTHNGLVIGSLTHDTWKTGIRYAAGSKVGQVDSLIVFGGAAIKDDPSLPASFGGYDGTHDHVLHGTIKDASVRSPLIYLSASSDVRKVFTEFGRINAAVAGRLQWRKNAPFYWNSFGVEGVLGYEKIMMPLDVAKISDFIHSLSNFNKYVKPVLSIDSYDQTIYSTNVLSSISRYGKKKGQQMGFYFGPFVAWTWKNSIDQTKLPGTDHLLRDVVLRDNDHNPIPYKNGEWAAYPLDPTHPGTRAYILSQLQKAKSINAAFIKIDFLSAGSLESSTRYNPAIRTGMQAYNEGMKQFKHLVDSVMGPDVFITMAISPLFPHQYGHTRFVSTDVYSHLRNDQPGFPGWGSTSASMISASYLWWVQGTLWPYTNMDVTIMKNFQKNPDLTEQEIKVRMISMVSLGSILGDGSDFRNPLAAERAKKFLDHPGLCAFFSQPKAFTPLRFAEGNSPSQQLSFYLPGDTLLVSAFNFDTKKEFKETFRRQELGWKNSRYSILDFLTGTMIGHIEKDQSSFSLTVPVKDALLVRLVPERM